MTCNPTESEARTRAAERHFTGIFKRVCSGMAWVALCGLTSACSGGGAVISSSGGPVPEVAFAIDGTANTVSVFTVDTTMGTWTAVGAIATGTAPVAVAVHPTGKFLYVANENSNNISVYRIEATTGALAEITGSPFAAVNTPHTLTVDSNGSFLYVSTITATAQHVLSGFTIDATSGALAPIAQAAVLSNTTTIGLAFAPTTDFLYAADINNDVTGFSAHAATGVLTPVPGNPFAAGSTPFGIAAHPAGKFVYVTNNASSNVSGYSVDAIMGGLTPVPVSPITSGTGPGAGPQEVAVEPKGKFLYVVNAGEVDLAAFSIDAVTGKLTLVTGSPFPLAVGTIPTAMAVEPSGSFMYVVNQLGNNIAVFMIQSNGSLTLLGTTLPGAGNVTAIGFRPGHP